MGSSKIKKADRTALITIPHQKHTFSREIINFMFQHFKKSDCPQTLARFSMCLSLFLSQPRFILFLHDLSSYRYNRLLIDVQHRHCNRIFLKLLNIEPAVTVCLSDQKPTITYILHSIYIAFQFDLVDQAFRGIRLANYSMTLSSK